MIYKKKVKNNSKIKKINMFVNIKTVIKFLYRNNSKDQGDELLKELDFWFLSSNSKIRKEGKEKYPIMQTSLPQWCFIRLLVLPLASSIVMKLIQIRSVK